MAGLWPRRMTAAAIAAAVICGVGGVSVSLRIAVGDHQSVLAAAFNAGVVVAFTVVGAVIAAARPRNRVGWFMLWGGALWGLGGAGADLAHHGIIVAPGSVPGASAYAVAGSATRSLGWYLITLGVPTYFPDGRLQSPRWRWIPKVLVVIFVCAVLDPLTDKQADLTNLARWHNPIALARPWDLVSGLAFLGHVPLSLVVTVGIVAQLAARWRQGDAFRRQQLKLFVGAAALPILAVPIVFGVGYGTGGWVFGAAALPLPFAIGFAVLAKGLYDLRTAVNRTLVWLTLSAVVAGVYALVIAGVGSRFNASSATWLPWVAAGIVAVSFAPLRDVLQRGVNRVTFGRWDEPYEVIAELGQRLEGSADIAGLLADVVIELHSLALSDVTISNLAGAVLAGDGGTAAGPVALGLSAYGRPVGQLRYRPPATPLRARDHRLLDDLAGHLGGVVYAHQLTLDLQQALERMTQAREEERRRLRRELHDGLGPALAGHLLRLDVLAGKVGRDSSATADIDSLRHDLRSTVIEVRRVVEGLRPPALDELGLNGALAQVTQRLTAGTVTAVDLDVADLPPLSAALEVAAYRIVTEAVTNVVRHANATICHIALQAHDGTLEIVVSDDGRGIDHPKSTNGNGLHTMRERAEELRGRLDVRSEHGTTVAALLPLPATIPLPARPDPATAAAGT